MISVDNKTRVYSVGLSDTVVSEGIFLYNSDKEMLESLIFSGGATLYSPTNRESDLSTQRCYNNLIRNAENPLVVFSNTVTEYALFQQGLEGILTLAEELKHDRIFVLVPEEFTSLAEELWYHSLAVFPDGSRIMYQKIGGK